MKIQTRCEAAAGTLTRGYSSVLEEQTARQGEIGGEWQYRLLPLAARFSLDHLREFDEPLPAVATASEENLAGVGFWIQLHYTMIQCGYDWYDETQTYLGLGEDLCANEGARSFITESTRELTPLGHVHRYLIREQLLIDDIRDMYHETMQCLLAETTSRSAYFGEAAVAIDTTVDDSFTGDREDHEEEIIGTKEDDNEYAYQWATIQTVGWGPRVMLDARPVRKGDI
jgi:hypothetical protein